VSHVLLLRNIAKTIYQKTGSKVKGSK